MKDDDGLKRLETMVECLLRGDNLIYWVGGYVYGESERGDPFILLYAASERLDKKVCRVYVEDFGKLPSFIPTAVSDGGDTGENVSRTVARKRGIYHECPLFEVVLYNGAETSMGAEKRFGDVTRLSLAAKKSLAGYPPPSPVVPAAPAVYVSSTGDVDWAKLPSGTSVKVKGKKATADGKWVSLLQEAGLVRVEVNGKQWDVTPDRVSLAPQGDLSWEELNRAIDAQREESKR